MPYAASTDTHLWCRKSRHDRTGNIGSPMWAIGGDCRFEAVLDCGATGFADREQPEFPLEYRESPHGTLATRYEMVPGLRTQYASVIVGLDGERVRASDGHRGTTGNGWRRPRGQGVMS
jgi:hypothetical protein